MFWFFTPVIRYFREAAHELRQVTWLSRKQVIAYTIVVVSGSVFVALILGATDLGFQRVITALIGFIR